MAKLDLTRETAPAFIERLQGIDGDTQRQWGTMGPAAMLWHLHFVLQLSLEEVTAKKIFMPMPSIVMWYLFFEWFTNWPKGKIEAPDDFFPAGGDNVDEARAACIDGVERFVARLDESPARKAFTPLLGNIPLRKWARLHGVHMDHHLRQFGV